MLFCVLRRHNATLLTAPGQKDDSRARATVVKFSFPTHPAPANSSGRDGDTEEEEREGERDEEEREREREKAQGVCVLAHLVIVIVGGSEKTQSLTRRVAGSILSLSIYRRQNLPTHPEGAEP